MSKRDLPTLVWELAQLQGSRCGICGNTKGTLVIDHDHSSGMVRGLLCQSCNHREGRHGCDDPPSTCDICLWRKQPAVTWIGWTVHYAIADTVGFAPSVTRVVKMASADRQAADFLEGLIASAVPS